MNNIDRMLLLAAIVLLRDRHPRLARDPLWHWIADQLAPASSGLEPSDAPDPYARFPDALRQYLARGRRSG